MSNHEARALRAEIARRKMTLKLAPFGIGEVLDLVDAWVASVEARLAEPPVAPAVPSAEQVAARQGRPVCEDCET